MSEISWATVDPRLSYISWAIFVCFLLCLKYFSFWLLWAIVHLFQKLAPFLLRAPLLMWGSPGPLSTPPVFHCPLSFTRVLHWRTIVCTCKSCAACTAWTLFFHSKRNHITSQLPFSSFHPCSHLCYCVTNLFLGRHYNMSTHPRYEAQNIAKYWYLQSQTWWTSELSRG